MSSRIPAIAAPSKDTSRQHVEAKLASTSATATPCIKPSGATVKFMMNKIIPLKEQSVEMSPPEDSSELLGSLTTQQQQRTSARVIKKLKLEPRADNKKRADAAADEIPDCETPTKTSEELKFPVKQRMPKALWSIDEKNLFFEALNEYGKDFDAITAYVCAKMKKKGMPDVNLKTKTQVSHFYYRTWHKLSKHVRFDENVKKVAQELYALINYGELRKKLVSVNEKTCGRLGEMVVGGSIMVRARGRNMRVRTPMCRALRRLNQITERACGSRVCARATVTLVARDAAAWARVQGAAHNPRLAVAAPPTASLRSLIAALAKRWQLPSGFKHAFFDDGSQERREDDQLDLDEKPLVTEDGKALHVGPRADVELHLPVVRPSAQLSSQKICFSSYLQRMRHHTLVPPKIRTPKRQRKDSTTEKDKEVEQKKSRLDEDATKLINIEETAIDGIELMATYKNNQEDERPSTEDEKEVDMRGAVDEEVDKEEKDDVLKVEEGAAREEGARERDMSEREKDSFSELEDDEKYAKSDTDNESDGKGKDRKFNDLKVKFRIRPKKRGGSIYTLVTDSDREERPDFDVELALKQIRAGWSVHDAGELTLGDLYLMFGNRSKLELDYWWAEPTPPLPQKPRPEPCIKTEKTEKTPDKGTDSSVEDEKGARESDADMLSPRNTFSQDSNDGSGDERKSDQPWSPEHGAAPSSLKLVSKLVNRVPPPPPADSGFSCLSDRLRRLLSLAGNPHVPCKARCACGHECPRRRPPPPPPPPPVFRPPAPIAPRPLPESTPPLELGGVPRGRRGRARVADRRVVVQRLLPLLPKLPPPTLIPVKLVPDSPPAPPRILPKPPPTSTSDLSFFYVLSESNGQFYFHDGDRRIPITQPNQVETLVVKDETHEDFEENPTTETPAEQPEACKDPSINAQGSMDPIIGEGAKDAREGSKEGSVKRELSTTDNEGRDIGSFLQNDTMSLSPSRLLHADGWLETSQDLSLSSFLGHLERAPPDLAVDSHLHSLMAESSVDYVAKFADLAAEVTDGVDPLAADDLT